MKITIKETTIELKYSFRAMMIYEKITGTTFNPKGITEIMIYFYSTVLASKKDIAVTFEEFMEWIDDNPTALNDFSQWLTSILSKNSVLNDNEKSDSKEEDTSKKK